MEDISEAHKSILQHTLGADSRYRKNQWGFRNHYCSGPNCHDYSDLKEMEKIGLLTSGENFGDVVFWATKKGALAIGFKPYQLAKLKFK